MVWDDFGEGDGSQRWRGHLGAIFHVLIRCLALAELLAVSREAAGHKARGDGFEGGCCSHGSCCRRFARVLLKKRISTVEEVAFNPGHPFRE